MRPFSGLAERVAGTLALALLPIGAIAVLQAVQISQEEGRRQQNALLNATAEAAAGDALAVSNASGAAGSLAAHMMQLEARGAGCSQIFEDILEANPQFSFAGFVDTEGIVQCASSDVGRDLSGGTVFPRMEEEREQIVVANQNGPISQTSVILVATPVFEADAYDGYVVISVPHRRISQVLKQFDAESMSTAIITFNAEGETLSSSTGFENVENILPAGQTLDTIVSERQYAFSSQTSMGENRSFAVVPIIPGVIYALGSQPRPIVGWATLAPILFPVLMLIVGLVAAFQAVDRLVIRHIHELVEHMAIFSKSRRVLPLSRHKRLTRELAEIDTVWTNLATRLLRDEAELENTLHEKNVLLKEVHHRVKNNLQLIASIVSLKIRRATSAEARRSLREVQGRVSSIAAVHQALYHSTNTGRVRADELLTNVIEGIIDAGTVAERRIDVTRDYGPVLLYPDQAVPFLLLASEAVTNALKYIGRHEDGSAELRISLEIQTEDRAELSVVNTLGEPLTPPDQVRGSGLGQSLMSGFAAQMGGEAHVEETEAFYAFYLRFSPAPFDPEAHDMVLDDVDPKDDQASG